VAFALNHCCAGMLYRVLGSWPELVTNSLLSELFVLCDCFGSGYWVSFLVRPRYWNASHFLQTTCCHRTLWKSKTKTSITSQLALEVADFALERHRCWSFSVITRRLSLFVYILSADMLSLCSIHLSLSASFSLLPPQFD
jgi:hypothetical protein